MELNTTHCELGSWIKADGTLDYGQGLQGRLTDHLFMRPSQKPALTVNTLWLISTSKRLRCRVVPYFERPSRSSDCQTLIFGGSYGRESLNVHWCSQRVHGYTSAQNRAESIYDAFVRIQYELWRPSGIGRCSEGI